MLSVAQVTGLRPDRFYRKGAFNVHLDEDSPLYVDPRLLHHTSTPELRGAAAEIDDYFGEILYLLRSSRTRGDRQWQAAEKRLMFKEPEGMHLGYGHGTRGAGMGRQYRDKILAAAQESLDLGYEDPRMLQFLILLEGGIGHDRISDMLCRITFARFLRYSERIFRELDVKGTPYYYGEEKLSLPRSPIDQKPIILAPREILAALPTSQYEWGIERICKDAQELRDYFNERLGKDWEKRLNREEIIRGLRARPKLFQVAREAFVQAKPEAYDFQTDKKGFHRPLDDALELAEANPVKLTLPANPTPTDLLHLVTRLCGEFKDIVENKGGAEMLWDHKIPRNERHVQRLFRALAQVFCPMHDLDLSPESNAGRGPVDFKFSRGAKGKVIVEMKLASNAKIEHAIEVQVPEYAEAEDADQTILLIVDFGLNEAESKKVKELAGQTKPEAQLFVIDASLKASASKFRPPVGNREPVEEPGR